MTWTNFPPYGGLFLYFCEVSVTFAQFSVGIWSFLKIVFNILGEVALFFCDVANTFSIFVTYVITLFTLYFTV